MHKQHGFSIIELMVVMAVSAMLMAGLLQMYLQVMRSGQKIEEYMDYGTQVMAVQLRVSQDFLGISKLWNTQYDYEHEDNRTGNFVKEPEKIERQQTLYAKAKGNKMDICTFVTTNGMMDMHTASRQFVRVVYKTEEDADTHLWKLLRKEIENPTANIDKKSLEKGTWYTVASDLKICTFEYGFIVPEDSKKEESKKDEGLKFVQKWNLLLKDEAEEDEKNRVKQTDEQEEKNIGALPLLVRITLLFDGQHQDDQIVYYSPLYIDGSSSLPSIFQDNKKADASTAQQEQVAEKAEGAGLMTAVAPKGVS